MLAESGILALSGGVGGAKLAAGLAACLTPSQLRIVANTGDDFEHLGLHIAPDLDSVMYALAGINDRQRGWGLTTESWEFMHALERLGGESWFQLGDRDLATHVQRSQQLRQGLSLSAATEMLCLALGVEHPLLPMSDDPVRTMVMTDQGELAFQHYFVEHQCRPKVSGFRFDGIERAVPIAELEFEPSKPPYAAMIICPSNPFVSVDPILNLSGVCERLRDTAMPRLAVSPIIGGKALKGPAAKMLTELGLSTDALGVAEYYADLISHFVIDEQDESLVPHIEALGLSVLVLPTIMRSAADQTRLATQLLSHIEAERGQPNVN